MKLANWRRVIRAAMGVRWSDAGALLVVAGACLALTIQLRTRAFGRLEVSASPLRFRQLLAPEDHAAQGWRYIVVARATPDACLELDSMSRLLPSGSRVIAFAPSGAPSDCTLRSLSAGGEQDSAKWSPTLRLMKDAGAASALVDVSGRVVYSSISLHPQTDLRPLLRSVSSSAVKPRL